MSTPSYVIKECLERKRNGESAKGILPYYIRETKRDCTPKSLSNRMRDWEKATLLKKVNVEQLWLLDEDKKPKKRIIGVIGDTHLPFEHKDYLQFVQESFIKWGVTDIVHVGDLVDHHAISRHQTEVDAMGGRSEYTEVKEKLKDWIEAFPKLRLSLGNHDLIPHRQAASMGLHSGFVKSFSQMYDLPKEWEISESFKIGNVLYTHGLGSGGLHGTLNFAIQQQMSVVVGHKHSCSGVRSSASANSLVFGLDTGCGIDKSKYAYAYGKFLPKKPILSCGVVLSDTKAHVEVMEL